MNHNHISLVLSKEIIGILTKFLDLFPPRDIVVWDTDVTNLVVEELPNLGGVWLLSQIVHAVVVCTMPRVQELHKFLDIVPDQDISDTALARSTASNDPGHSERSVVFGGGLLLLLRGGSIVI